MVHIARDTPRRVLAQPGPRRAGGGTEKGDTVLDRRVHAALGLGHDLVSHHLLADQEVVAVVEIHRTAQPKIDAVAQLSSGVKTQPLGLTTMRACRGARCGSSNSKSPSVCHRCRSGDRSASRPCRQGSIAMDHDQAKTRSYPGRETGPEAPTATSRIGSGNGSATRRVPQNWQKTTSSELPFPQRTHLIMRTGLQAATSFDNRRAVHCTPRNATSPDCPGLHFPSALPHPS